MIEHREIYRKPGEFAAWPANYGLWIWGDEVVTIFSQGFMGPPEDLHARDKTRPFIGRQARSLDGGLTWKIEPFNGIIPGSNVLSGDEHVIEQLQCGPNMDGERDLLAPDAPIDFLDPETIVMCARTGLLAGSVSWFYVSHDRARSWKGPYALGGFGQTGVSARTDIVALSPHDALFLLTASKDDGTEGRVFCARTRDGGKSFTFEGFVGDEPEGFSIMPASLRLDDGAILSAVRCMSSGKGAERRSWIDLYRSTDTGVTWSLIAQPAPTTGYGSNPPTLTLMPDGRLVIIYGQRDAPFGMQAVVSFDNGINWSKSIILRGDGGMSDLGYPRTVLRSDGSLLTVYYFNYGINLERFIACTIFTPDA